MTQEDSEFIWVPVPREFVTDVYTYIGELKGAGAAGSPAWQGKSPQGDGQWQRDAWTVQDLRLLAGDGRDSVRTVAAILDILAKQPTERVSYSVLVDRLGTDRKQLRGALSAFTRVLHKHYQREHWPMWWVEAASTEEGLKTEFFYWVSEAVAARWREARGEAPVEG